MTPKLTQLPVAYCCPHCNSTNFIRNGFSRGIQRYRCKSCHRTFKDTTDTPIHGLHKKDKIEKYLEALRAGLSIRKAAKYVGISKNTAFAWRHKLLSSLNQLPKSQESQTVAGIAIIRTPYSAKGRKKEPEKHQLPSKSILIATDSGLIIKKLQHIKSTKDAIKTITSNIKKGYATTIPDHLLTSAIKQQESIKNIKASKQAIEFKKKALVSIEILEEWMQKFKGVASKYLQNYWSWHMALNSSKMQKNETESFNRWAIISRSLNNYRKTAIQ